MGHADGICSIYLDESAQVGKAVRVVVDSKVRCGVTLLRMVLTTIPDGLPIRMQLSRKPDSTYIPSLNSMAWSSQSPRRLRRQPPLRRTLLKGTNNDLSTPKKLLHPSPPNPSIPQLLRNRTPVSNSLCHHTSFPPLRHPFHQCPLVAPHRLHRHRGLSRRIRLLSRG